MSRSFDAHSSYDGKPGVTPMRSPHGSFGVADFRQNMEMGWIKARRAQTAQSSRGSGSGVDSFFIEQFTSSSSEAGDSSPILQARLPPQPAAFTVERCDSPFSVPGAQSASPSEARDPPPVLPGQPPSEPAPLTVERCNSSSSISLPSGNVLSVDKRRTWASKLKGKAQHAVSKRRAKKLVTQLVSLTDDSSSSKRRRQEAASGLVEMASSGPDGKDIVARRFVKTAAREEKGIRALLSLNDEELQSFHDLLWEEPPHPLASTATDLIELVVSRSTEGTFSHKTLPTVLRDARSGVGAILRLLERHPELLTQIGHEPVFRFGTRFVAAAVPLTVMWSRGVKLLVMLLDRLSEAPLETKYSIHLPLLRVLLQGCTEGFLWVGGNAMSPGKVGSLDAAQLLRYIFRVLTEVREDAEALDMIIPSRPSLNRLVANLMIAFAPEDHIWDGDTLNATALLALNSLSVLLQSRTVRKNVDITVVSRWAGLFMGIVLQPSRWQASFAHEPLAAELGRTDLKPETPAFHILCCLPEPAFAKALAFALSQCNPQATRLTLPPYKNYRVIESLLRLSNTRQHYQKTSLALIQGGTCQYLARVLSCNNPEDRSNRTFWRAKGLAMTCLGNIMERMDREDLRCHVGKGIIESAVSIKEDCEAPTMQKGQAIFMLQRYNLVADQCGIEPFYKEALL